MLKFERDDVTLKIANIGLLWLSGNENGFIEESKFVNKIGKGASEAQDYHNNINESFRKWLFEHLDTHDRISSNTFLIVQQKDGGHAVNNGFESLRNWGLYRTMTRPTKTDGL
ncbi:unnamed protein product [Allacma fusca]|uniref:Uncharacterized protein n=1 Tax=Allacma fusca TaxID=39272 RepID=A0A8J2KU26_9HEXA|nr:unnamed protein product [Allacma fusca]